MSDLAAFGLNRFYLDKYNIYNFIYFQIVFIGYIHIRVLEANIGIQLCFVCFNYESTNIYNKG